MMSAFCLRASFPQLSLAHFMSNTQVASMSNMPGKEKLNLTTHNCDAAVVQAYNHHRINIPVRKYSTALEPNRACALHVSLLMQPKGLLMGASNSSAVLSQALGLQKQPYLEGLVLEPFADFSGSSEPRDAALPVSRSSTTKARIGDKSKVPPMGGIRPLKRFR